MASSFYTSRDLAHLFWVIISLLLCFICACMIGGNCLSYSTYQQAEVDAKVFSLETICRIDRIISRPQEDKGSSMLIINSTFLVSFEITSNGSRSTRQFEEWSVPVPLQPDVVGQDVSIQFIRFKAPFLFNC